jgi:Glycosyl hydrolase family 59/Galactocerebrosidase, C-terminal lectin domain/Glycosyl hydrolase family 59 central domain
MKSAIILACAGICSLTLMAVPARGASIPATSITVNGNSGDRVYSGVGAVLGGGGNARYLEEYPAAERASILNYLFKPGYGASLQLLKLEIGGDGNSTDGAEPSVEHTRGDIDCSAGYELSIAQQAVALNPHLRLYGLQWGAPAWVGHNGSLFTSADITYLLDWLGCAKRFGLTVSYLGGWNERDNGAHASWFHSLRSALNSGGFKSVRIVAGDSRVRYGWAYASSRDVAILGVHDNCGYPTGVARARTKCSTTTAALDSAKPLWASELGAMDGGARSGCTVPCAPAMDRAFVREYIDARVTGALEWPVLDSMPPDLPYENRGLITADQPWSGHYRVNAMTWAIAHITQFAWPPTPANPGGWKFIDSASGFLQGNRADGSYITLVRSSRDQWSTIIETTTGVIRTQRVIFTVKGGRGIAGRTVHVWASDFSFSTGGPSKWFVRQPDIKPVNGRFTLTIKPGYVYSLTTTTGQGKGKAAGPPAAALPLPYRNNLGAGNDEPSLLTAEDGSFELAPCRAPDGSITCAEQTAVGPPVLWRPGPLTRHPYALTGSDWANYVVSVDVMLPQAGSAGLIGRYDAAAMSPAHGTFSGYVFDVNTDGSYTLTLDSGGKALRNRPGHRQVRPVIVTRLAAGTVPFGVRTWHTLALSMSGAAVTASVDGEQVASVSSATLTHGMPGIEVGGWYPAQFSNLQVSSLTQGSDR